MWAAWPQERLLPCCCTPEIGTTAGTSAPYSLNSGRACMQVDEAAPKPPPPPAGQDKAAPPPPANPEFNKVLIL